jgi:hypothetical protein
METEFETLRKARPTSAGKPQDKIFKSLPGVEFWTYFMRLWFNKLAISALLLTLSFL